MSVRGGKPARPAGKNRKTKRRGRLLWYGFWLAAILAFAAMAVYLYFVLLGERLLRENLQQFDNLPEATVIYDRNGREVHRLYRENRDVVSLEEMPELLPLAFIATEDQRFYTHPGVDIWSIGRAVVKDLIHRRYVEGGSTITQQLAKNLFLHPEKTLMRKATEAGIALALENNFEKDEILEMYLNTIFFGQRAHGVKAASQIYFGKSDLKQLELWEIATLAAIPKAPSYYNPITDPEKSKERRQVVLRLMHEQGYITREQMEEAAAVDYSPPAALSSHSGAGQAYIDYVLQEVNRSTGLTEEQLLAGGYHIYTAMDSDVQRIVEKALSNPEVYPPDGPEQKVQSGMVVLDHHTGEILAMYGGRDYVPRGLNRAVAKQPPGSSFKPVAVYGPALETGRWHPYSRLKDEPLNFGNYRPRNYNGKYSGEVSMRTAVRDSLNVPAVWLLQQIGVERGIEFAQKAGIAMDANDRHLAIALGGLTYGASPLEMAQAYAAFANEGVWTEAHAVVKILDTRQRVVFERKPETRRIMSAANAWYMTDMLQEAVNSGTGKNARMNRPVAGKTGTTQHDSVRDANRNVWFVGYTPEWTAAVWIGFDRSDGRHFLTSGSGVPARLFADVMSAALKDRPVKGFARPEGVRDFLLPPSVGSLTVKYDEDGRRVELSWSKAGSGLQYRLYRKEADEEEFLLLLETLATDVADLTVRPGAVYQYRVAAYDPDAQLEGEPSQTVEVAIPLMENELLLPDESSEQDLPPEPDQPPEPDVSPEPDEMPDRADPFDPEEQLDEDNRNEGQLPGGEAGPDDPGSAADGSGDGQ